MGLRVFITVADPSADQHAANLVKRLRALSPDIALEGLGGPRLHEAGVVVHYDTVTKAAMGWRAALRAWEMSRVLKWTRHYWQTHPFDLLICCDSWSIHWHYARLAHQIGMKVLYYIAPQTWASREGRIRRLRAYVDQVACILPFEEAYFSRHGVKATFVGHPLFDELPARRAAPLAPVLPAERPPVIGLLAGSRRSIASANFPRLLRVARQLSGAINSIRFVCPTTPTTHAAVSQLLEHAATDASLAQVASRITVQQNAFDELVPTCDLCLTVSGTAALHVAALGVPLIVVYYGNPLLWWLIGRWVIKTRTYSLVNLLNDFHEHVVPEFIPWYGSVKPVVRCAMGLLNDPPARARQRDRLSHLTRSLDQPGASQNTARLALEMLAPIATVQTSPTPALHID